MAMEKPQFTWPVLILSDKEFPNSARLLSSLLNLVSLYSSTISHILSTYSHPDSFNFANSFIRWVGCNFLLRPNCNMGWMDGGWWWWWWSSFCESQGCETTAVVDMGYIVNVHWMDGCSTKTTPAFKYTIWLAVPDKARLGCRTKGGYNNRGRDFGPQVRTGGVGWLSRIRHCVCWWKRARIRTSGILLCHMGS